MSTTSSAVFGSFLVAAALALGLTWPRHPVANEPSNRPAATLPTLQISDIGRYQLFHVPNYFPTGGVSPDFVGRTKGATVYVLDTKTGRLLTEFEAKMLKASE